jgi:hypothetical protein
MIVNIGKMMTWRTLYFDGTRVEPKSPNVQNMSVILCYYRDDRDTGFHRQVESAFLEL